MLLFLRAYFLFRFSIIFSRFMTEGAFISAISAIHFVALPRLLKRDGVNNVMTKMFQSSTHSSHPSNTYILQILNSFGKHFLNSGFFSSTFMMCSAL